MEIIPAIDIMGGRCVQLVGGRPETKKDFGDPIERALDWRGQGAKMLHIVDLDATLGIGENLELIRMIKDKTRLPIEFGGGIRSLTTAESVLKILDKGDRIIIGTMAVSEFPVFDSLRRLSQNRGRLIVSVDSKEGYVAIKGWKQKSGITTLKLMQSLGELCWGFLYTNVDIEGQMKGIDETAVKKVVNATNKPVIVSGGVTTLTDIRSCRDAGAWAVVLGKALYEGKITLEEALR